MKENVLKIAEANQKDVGRGRIRINDYYMRKIGISPGNIVELINKDKKTGLIVYLADNLKNNNEARVDGITRRNLKVKIGETVIIRKANEIIAEKITIAPLKELAIDLTLKNYVKQKLMGYPVKANDIVLVQLLGQAHRFIIKSTFPNLDEIFIIVEKTKFIFVESENKFSELKISYEDIGGLRVIIQKIREMVELPLRYPELFQKLGISPPKGILIHGPPGTGKTLIAKAVANESEAFFISIQGPEIMSKFYGESEARLRDIFKNASENSPSIIFIDEIDAIASKRDDNAGEVERRVVAQILSLMDGISSRGNVIVIGASNRPNAIDQALRRPGRFDREIYTNVPDQSERLEILQIHTRRMPGIENVDLEKLSRITHGFVGADLAALGKEAAMNSLRDMLPLINMEKEEISSSIIDQLIIKESHFISALKEIQPTAIREIFVEKPKISWERIGGLKDIKQSLNEMIDWPIKKKDILNNFGISSFRGVLLYGPPGTGKTLIARAAAANSESNFISVKGSDLLSKWVGESEKKLNEIFKKARMISPTIIFIDEIDAFAVDRSSFENNNYRVGQSLLAQLLSEFDSLKSIENIVIIAATNRPDLLDTALLRPGRFDRILYVKPPNLDERIELFKIFTLNIPLDLDVNLPEMARNTAFYTGAEIENVCREAVFIALREDEAIKEIQYQHFQTAMNNVNPSISPEIISFYENFQTKFKSKMFQKKLFKKESNFDFI